MRFLQKQFHNKRGASMVIALVFLLLCTMVGTVVITAASAGIGAVISEREDAQTTLALTSAAEYVSAELQSLTYTASYVERMKKTTTSIENTSSTEATTYTVTSFENATYPANAQTSTLSGSKLFVDGKFDFSALSKVDDEGKTTSGASVVYTLKFSVSDGTVTDESTGVQNAYNIPVVNGKLTVSDDYTAKLVLVCGSDSMTLNFPATVKRSTQREKYLYGAVSESDLDLNPQIKEEGSTVTKTTDTTHTTTVKWDAPTIEKGGEIA